MTRLSSDFIQHLVATISKVSGESITSLRVTSLGASSVNTSYRLSASERDYFLKINSADRSFMFEAERAALNEIARTNTTHVPLSICAGAFEEQSFIVLEWLRLYPLDEAAAGRFGRLLAALHRHTTSQFGWHRDNTIGATKQVNTFTSDWLQFWKTHRLGFQLQLAEENGYTGRLQDLGMRLLEHCADLFSGYSPQPSLLHGDLWHGNTACDASGEPVIFDPASYYGDREADLAMTSLFGGFPDAFMAAYNASWPVHEGYGIRRDFYNVYHLLNHLNLFGKGYLAQTESIMQRVLAQLA